MKFASFWAGARLSAIEFCCLQSYVHHGQDITLFSFDKVENVPSGVGMADAAEVVPRETMNLFLINGKPAITPFSDYFRYLMFKLHNLIWVDTDMFMLSSFEIPDGANLVAREDAKVVNPAILRLTPDDPVLTRMLRECELRMGKNLSWGEMGPKLLTRLLGEATIRDAAHPPEEFYPIHYDDFWKVFLPEHHDECVALCRDAKTVHLWSNIIDRLGFWKDLLPPEGSFLHSLFAQGAPSGLFSAAYPASVVRRMVENWRMRQSGGAIGIGSVVKQCIPSIGRTIRHYTG